MSTIEGVYGFQKILPPPIPPLYAFTNMTFTSASLTGRTGPTFAQCKTAYASESWTSNSNYFNMTTQGYQLWTVPATGNYSITCQGAEGASPLSIYTGSSNSNYNVNRAGYGANITGTLTLTQGDIYKIVVGQKASNGTYGGGGGGGSFFASSSNTPLVCAGGGGAGSYYGNYQSCNTNYGNYPLCNSVDGVAGLNGSRGGYSPYGGGSFISNGGSNGNGGGRGGNGGGEEAGGGGGFTGDGQNDTPNSNSGGKSFVNGAIGGLAFVGYSGSDGGFGGGGAGYQYSWYSGGGGGGYSGGGAGGVYGNGGGGGSYNAGSNQVNIPGASSGGGYVYIEKEVVAPPPTPLAGTFTIAAATLIGTATWPRTIRTASYTITLYKNSSASTSGATLVSTATGVIASSVTFSSMSNSTYYYFTVTSVNTYGSTLGPISSFAIPTVPTAPTITGFSVDSKTMVATITWNASADTNSYTIQLYKNSTQSTSGATLVTTSTGITGLTAGYTITPFYYHYILLTSVNLAGSSTASQSSYILSVIPSTPSTPTIVMNSATMVITVNWTTTQWAVTYNVTLYSNTIQSTSGATLVSTQTGLSGLTTTFSTLSPFTYYYVLLTATNQTGTSSAAQSAYVISAVPTTPSPPILYVSSSLVGNASWDAQPNAATYTVYLYSNASSNYSGTLLATNTSISGLSTTFSSLVQGTYYYATMTGTNSTGTSSASSNSSIAVYDPAGLYSFTSFTFTNAGATLRYGPTLAQCRTAYSSASWIAASNPYYFNVSPQGIQNWAVPKTGDYTITCVGAKGGAGSYTNYPGGLGTTMIGTFTLTRDTILHILVGQIGEQNTNYVAAGGGGGGSFVVTGTNTPLICAGGGAGGNNNIPQTNLAYLLQSVTTTTANPSASYSGIEPTTAGSNGSGGKPSQYYPNGGAPGGGLLTDGVNPTKVGTYSSATAGKAFVNGGVGGLNSAINGGSGGFGGGGGADWVYYIGPGGGGGYSGGGGTSASASSSVSGGGGSYNGGSNQSNTAANNSGMGYVTIVAL